LKAAKLVEGQQTKIENGRTIVTGIPRAKVWFG